MFDIGILGYSSLSQANGENAPFLTELHHRMGWGRRRESVRSGQIITTACVVNRNPTVSISGVDEGAALSYRRVLRVSPDP